MQSNILTCSISVDSKVADEFFYNARLGVDFDGPSKSQIESLVEQNLNLQAEGELKSKNMMAELNIG